MGNQETPDDSKVVDYWDSISDAWTGAVRNEEIESRTLITNSAIVETILDLEPTTVLDLGCGEGWLCRELATHSISATGLDAIEGLIEQARRAGSGDFRVASYEQISSGSIEVQADVVVCNFSLLGNKVVESLMETIPSLLNPDGSFVVQTLHPITAAEEAPYVDGWRYSPWTGFGPRFSSPSPWYFRTLENWIHLFDQCGLRLTAIKEPLHPRTNRPASVIFVLNTR